MDLKELKKEYEHFEKKYKLPSFNNLNEYFEIEKIDQESDILLKIIRKIMVEKIVHSLGFVEMLLSPMNAPRMYHAYIKNMGEEDKKNLDEIYESFSDLSNDSLTRELDYSEKGEAELIKKVFETWNKMKPHFVRVLENIKKPTNVGNKERSYYG